MPQSSPSKAFFNFFILNTFLQAVLRLFEVALIFLYHGGQEVFLGAEILGFIFDVIYSNALLLLTYPVYLLLHKVSEKLANTLFLVGISIAVILHFAILRYFLHSLIPLDTFLFQYTLDEVILSINTSGLEFVKAILFLLLTLTLLYFCYAALKRHEFHSKTTLWGYVLIFLTLPLAGFIQYSGWYNQDVLTQNKSLFFYGRSLSYFLIPPPETTPYILQDAVDFQNLRPHHNYTDYRYPLLHTFEATDSLSAYFAPFESPPNLVLVFVEGLNDDFIHHYHGANIMPFLDSLKNNSLYWRKCFSLGERSFAVIPSVLGGLPYGEKGFTLLEKFPRHFSLFSILNQNDYFSSFYISQSGWFHQNDKYFGFNDADVFLEKEQFAEKYSKIVVRAGQDDYFWGYNDKDLFSQAMEIIDSIGAERTIDVYFTGTSHSPYVISTPELYEQEFERLVKGLKKPEDIAFFQHYKKIILTLLFTDDALSDLVKGYQMNPNYENTLFLITGDHPMTEIPTQNSLKRFHVPLFIFSPKMKQATTFSNVVSHLDIYETLLAFLQNNDLKIPSYSTSLGNTLFDTNDSKQKIVFMNDNREIVDYYSKGYYLSRQQLHEVGEDLSLKRIKNTAVRQQMQKELQAFKKTSRYVSTQNKIVSDSLFCRELNRSMIFTKKKDSSRITFEEEYHTFIEPIEVQNKTLYYDAFFEYEGDIDASTSLVYELVTKEGKNVFWKNSSLHNRKNSLQVHLKIPQQNVPDSSLIFKSYLWNRQKRKTTFFNSEASLQMDYLKKLSQK